MDEEAARHGGISLMGTVGATWLLRPDETFWEVDDDFGRPLQPLAEELHTTALVAGTERHGWLAELLPSRSPGAVACSECNGQGKIHNFAYCQKCKALGWLPPPM